LLNSISKLLAGGLRRYDVATTPETKRTRKASSAMAALEEGFGGAFGIFFLSL
jgi:hypothetical protein